MYLTVNSLKREQYPWITLVEVLKSWLRSQELNNCVHYKILCAWWFLILFSYMCSRNTVTSVSTFFSQRNFELRVKEEISPDECSHWGHNNCFCCRQMRVAAFAAYTAAAGLVTASVDRYRAPDQKMRKENQRRGRRWNQKVGWKPSVARK